MDLLRIGVYGVSFALVSALTACGEKLPSDEAALVKIVRAHAKRWDGAPNDIQREPIRGQRDAALCTMPKEVRGWTGTVETIGTNLFGDAWLKVKIAPNVSVSTETLLDTGGSTIKRGTSMFDSVSKLTRGQEVVFSGRLLTNEHDCLREASLTEAGSLHAPEFLFFFEKIAAK